MRVCSFCSCVFVRGFLFSGARRAAGGFVACCVHVRAVGVSKALKSPFNLGACFALQDVTDRGKMVSCTKY